MMKRRRFSIGRFLLSFVAVAVLAGAIGGIVYYTNGFTADVQTFVVSVNGKPLGENDTVTLNAYETLRVDCDYPFDVFAGDPRGCFVEIVPDVSHDNDFDYTANGMPAGFGAERDLTPGFDVVYVPGGFELLATKNIAEVLAACYPEETITVPKIDMAACNYFRLNVYSYNRKTFVSYPLQCDLYFVIEDITIDSEGVLLV